MRPDRLDGQCTLNRYYDPTTAQFLTVDPDYTSTGSRYGYVGDNPLNQTDPLGLHSWRIFSDVANGVGDVGQFAANHKVAIGIGLGILSVATGGLGLTAELAFEGTILTTTAVDTAAVASGLGAAALDYGPCRSGDTAACIGAGLGAAGAGLGAPAVIGDLVGIEADTLPYAVLKALSALGFTFGAGGLTIDAALAGECP